MSADLEERFYRASLSVGMTEEEARRAARDALARQEWRLRRGAKECGSCHASKPVREFGKDSSRRDGRAARCLACEKRRGKRG